MAIHDAGSEGPRRRSKGRPARIDREKIVEAARALAPERVTMQAVAEILGVDPTALNYHVGGRDAFLRLVALDRARMSAEALADLGIESDWESMLRAFARAMRSSVASIGALAQYLEFDSSVALAYMAPMERTLEALVCAGLDASAAVRALALVAHLSAHTGTRDAKREAGDRPHGAGFRALLEGGVEGEFPLIRSLFSGELPGFDPRDPAAADRQFDFELDTIIAGLRAGIDEGAARA